ncbi:M14 family zinc carboxypeptidase [Bacteroidota bacterium]
MKNQNAIGLLFMACLLLSILLSESVHSQQAPYYQVDRLYDYIHSVKDHPLMEYEVIGKSVEGRDLFLFTITDKTFPDSKKTHVWLQFRVHGDEMEVSYIHEGLVNYLLSSEPESLTKEILSRMVFHIVPCINPDGVADTSRNNANDQNLNRCWSDSTNSPNEQPEIKAVHAALDNVILDQGQKIPLLIDFHTWGGENGDGGYYLNEEVMGPALLAEQKTFLRTLERFDKWQNFEAWLSGEGLEGGARLMLFRQHKINPFTSETTGGKRFDSSMVTIESLHDQGVAFTKAIYSYLFNVHFTDTEGNHVNTYGYGDKLYVRLEDDDANKDSLIADIQKVTIISSSGDNEVLLLEESGPNTGIFRLRSGVLITVDAPSSGDGIVQTEMGELITVKYKDTEYFKDTCWDEALISD